MRLKYWHAKAVGDRDENGSVDEGTVELGTLL